MNEDDGCSCRWMGLGSQIGGESLRCKANKVLGNERQGVVGQIKRPENGIAHW